MTRSDTSFTHPDTDSLARNFFADLTSQALSLLQKVAHRDPRPSLPLREMEEDCVAVCASLRFSANGDTPLDLAQVLYSAHKFLEYIRLLKKEGSLLTLKEVHDVIAHYLDLRFVPGFPPPSHEDFMEVLSIADTESDARGTFRS